MSLIPRGKKGRILDLGSGTFPYFLSQVDFNKKYALDKGLEDNTSFPKKISKVDLDLEKQKFPFKDNTIDVITMLAVIEHLNPKSAPEVLKEAKRVLKPNGVIIVTTPSFWTSWILKIAAKLNLVSEQEISEHKKSYSKDELIGQLISGGFERKRIKHGYFEMYMNQWVKAAK